MLGGCLLSRAKSDGKANKRIGGWVLVTGASAGIGTELARAFAARRYDLVLAARNEAALEALGRELAASCAVRVKTAPVDLSEPGAPKALAEALAAAGVEVGVLVNNAGVLSEGPFAAGPIGDLVNLLQVNVVALTALTRLFLEPMVARGEGRILNVASIAAFMPVPDLAAYAASKAYVLSLTEALGVELGGTGVAATALCPGLTDTAMVRGSRLGRAPALMTMTAKEVAEAGCAACLSGEAVVRARPRQPARRGRRAARPEGARPRDRRRPAQRRLRAARGRASGPRSGERERQAMSSVQANGITIEYEELGPPDAPAILLIMGLGMQLVAWPDSLCEGLAARGFRVVRFDNRDIGLSTRMPSAGSLRTERDDGARLPPSAGAAALHPQRHGARHGRADGRTGHRRRPRRRRVDGRHDRADRRRRAPGPGEESRSRSCPRRPRSCPRRRFCARS